MRSPSHFTWIILPLLLAMVACGQLKKADDKIIAVQGSGAAAGTTESGTLPADLRKLKDFLDLYTENGSITRSGMANLLNKYKDKIGGFLNGTGMSTGQIVDFLFQFDINRDGVVSPNEVAEALYQHIPVLRWIPSNITSIDSKTLDADLASEYPGTSTAARDGLRDTLLRFDEKWAGGDGDGLLSRQELSVAGLLIGILAEVDFSHGIQLPPQEGTDQGTNDKKLAVGLLNQKLNQQLFARYPMIKGTELSRADAQLEYMQLALRFYLCDKLVFSVSSGSLIAPRDQLTAISLYRHFAIDLSPNSEQWTSLLKIYSHPMMGGTESGNWNTVVTFNVMTELDYAAKIWTLKDHKNHDYLMRELSSTYPAVGKSLFSPRYWDHLNRYDDQELGGNEDGNIGLSEFALALAYARVIDGVFATYDTDHNGRLSKAEAVPLFKSLKYDDSHLPSLIEGFYANRGGMDGRHQLWTELKIFFTGASRIDNLDPYEFHKRLIQVLPHLLNGETVK